MFRTLSTTILLISTSTISIAQNSDTFVVEQSRSESGTNNPEGNQNSNSRGILYHTGEYNSAQTFSLFNTGLLVTSGGAQQDEDPVFLIRGMMSQNIEDNLPLIILDGAPYYGRFSDIAFETIQNVKVLKDAVAIGRYGVMGRNGVVQITSKSGDGLSDRNKKHTLNVLIKSGINTNGIQDYKTIKDPSLYYQMQWRSMQNHYFQVGLGQEESGYIASGLVPGMLGIADILGYQLYNINNIQLLDPQDGSMHPDAELLFEPDNWGKAVSRLGGRQSYNLDYKLHTSKFSLMFNAGYINDNSYIRHNGYQRFSGSVFTTWNPLKWLELKLNAKQTYTVSDLIHSPNSLNGPNPILSARYTAPIYPMYYRNSQGDFESDPVLNGERKLDWGNTTLIPNSSKGTNPFNNTNPLGVLLLDKHQLNRSISYINPQINLKLPFGFSFNNALTYQLLQANRERVISSQYPRTGNMNGSTALSKSELKSTYYHGYLNWYKMVNEHTMDINVGVDLLNNHSKELSATTIGGIPASGLSAKNRYALESMYSSLQYDFKQKYFFESNYTLRKIGIYIRGQQQKSFALGAAWDVAKEEMFKKGSQIHKLKLKTSYGQFDDWRYVANGLGGPGLPSIHDHFNVGLEVGLFKGALSIDVNYFVRSAKKEALQAYRSSLQILENIAGLGVKNSGLELSLNVHKKISNLQWIMDINHNYLKNEVVSMPEDLQVYFNGFSKISVGNPLLGIDVYEQVGVNKTDGRAYYYSSAHPDGKTLQINDLDMYKDSRHFGTALPVHWGAIVNAFQYKNWKLLVGLNYGFGNKVLDYDYFQLTNVNHVGMALHEDILNAWTFDNTNSSIPALNMINTPIISNRIVTDGRYLNIKAVSLAYQVPPKILEKLKLKSLEVTASCNNVYMFTARSGLNPMAYFGGRNDYFSFYPMRNYSLGINFGLM